jgi:hypothetical protein
MRTMSGRSAWAAGASLPLGVLVLGFFVVFLLGSFVSPGAAGQKGKRKDFIVQPEHLTCILEWEQVRNFRITNPLGKRKLRKALRVAKRQRGRYPVGTIIQLIPFEVMVKRRKGFSPETRDWEFLTLKGFRRFRLELDAETGQPAIDIRGTTEVVNFVGGNCFACHSAAAKRFDLVCERDHGCASLPPPLSIFTVEQFVALARVGDPRCADLPE